MSAISQISEISAISGVRGLGNADFPLKDRGSGSLWRTTVLWADPSLFDPKRCVSSEFSLKQKANYQQSLAGLFVCFILLVVVVVFLSLKHEDHKRKFFN